MIKVITTVPFLQTESGDALPNPILSRRHLTPSLLPIRSMVHFWQYPHGVNAKRKRRLLQKALRGPQNLRFREMVAHVEAFGSCLSRVKGSHHIFARPDVREFINIQDVRGQAKPTRCDSF